MLEQQDIKHIREVVREEISGTNENVSSLNARTTNVEQKVSSLQQDVSVLKQDVSTLKQDVSVLKGDMGEVKHELRNIGVLMEDQGKTMQLILENLSQNNHKADEMPEIKNKVKKHEMRIGSLELAVKSGVPPKYGSRPFQNI